MSLTAPSPTSQPQQPAAQPNSTIRVGVKPSPHTTSSKRVASPTPLFVHPTTPHKRARTGMPTYRKQPSLDGADGHLIFQENHVLGERYITLSKIGRGTFGQVFKCHDLLLDKQCAVKVIRSAPKYRESGKIELRVLEKLQETKCANDNKCAEIRAHFFHDQHICMVFDLLAKSVFDFLKMNKFLPFKLKHVRSIAHQLLQGAAYLHKLKLVHTDIKPENVMLVDATSQLERFTMIKDKGADKQAFVRYIPHSSDVQLVDFGSATFENEFHAATVSTRHYRAPEVILGVGWSYPCDIWSIGCVAMEMFTGNALFDTKNDDGEHLAMMEKVLGHFPKSIIQKASSQSQQFFDDDGRVHATQLHNQVEALDAMIIPQTSEHRRLFIDLIHMVLALDPSKRITAEEALQHPFFDREYDKMIAEDDD